MALHAQSADSLSEMIDSSAVTYGQACYFAAVQAGILDDTATYRQAFDTLMVHGYVPAGHTFMEEISLEHFAFIYAKIWNISGGLFYHLFHNPRYALRELKADGIIPQTGNPTQKLTGHEALNIISAGIERYQTQGTKD